MVSGMSVEEATADTIVRALLSLYSWLVSLITGILQQTILKDNPELAREYGSAITLLVSLTAVYLIAVLISAFRKILGILIAIGWVVLILAIILRTFR
jgi:ABC-type transport system involved in multi-copper enzyme maturation permease subunit